MKITVRQLKQLIKEQVEEVKRDLEIEETETDIPLDGAKVKSPGRPKAKAGGTWVFQPKEDGAFRFQRFCDRVTKSMPYYSKIKPSGKLGVYVDRKGKKLATLTPSEVDEGQVTLVFDKTVLAKAVAEAEGVGRACFEDLTSAGGEKEYLMQQYKDPAYLMNVVDEYAYERHTVWTAADDREAGGLGRGDGISGVTDKRYGPPTSCCGGSSCS